MKRRQPERDLQRAVCDFLAHALPKDCWFSAIPGGNRGVTTTPGYVSGTPDVLVLARIHGSLQACWIELKAKRGRRSPAQVIVHEVLEMLGCYVVTLHSVEEVEATLREWGIRLRATVSRRAA